jgi:hypothetical protein
MYKILTNIFLISMSLVIVVISNAYGVVYYVKNGGNDTAAGTSDATAWETIGKVNKVELKDGDTVLFKRGSVFYDATLINPQADNITFADYGTGNKPVFDGDRIAPIDITADNRIKNLTIKNIDISGQDWMVSKSSNVYIYNVEGVHLHGIVGDGHKGGNKSDGKTAITVRSCSGEVEVADCELYNWGATDLLSSDRDFMGIVIYTQNEGTYTIKNNIIYHIGADGIQLFDSVAPGIVSENTVYNCGENSLDVKGCSNVQVSSNEFYRTTDFVGEGGSGSGGIPCYIVIHEGVERKQSTNVIVSDNYIHDGDVVGVKMGSVEKVRIEGNRFLRLPTSIFIGNPCNNLEISNNTIIDAFHRAFESHGYEGGCIYENNSGHVSIHHNTVVNLNGDCTSLLTLACCYGTEVYRNIIYNNAVNIDSMVVGLYVHGCGADPKIYENCIYVSGAKERVFYKGTVYSENEITKWNSIAKDDIFVNPQFASVSTQDFRLKATTPCKTDSTLWGSTGIADLLAPTNLRKASVN